MSKQKLGILLSGRGSNFLAIADSVAAGRINPRGGGAEIAVVISNRASAPGLEAARARGIEAIAVPSQGMDRQDYDGLVLAELNRCGVDLVCLAGYMRMLSPAFVRAFPHRIVNIHPSLLPAFPGLDAQQQAFDYGVRVAGCTVHFVDEQLDAGPIILQAAIDVRAGDTPDTLAARILAEEHKLYTEAINVVLGGKWRIEGRRVVTISHHDVPG